MARGITGNLYETKILPNSIEELVVAIYDQEGADKVSRQEALDMADFLERERYVAKPSEPFFQRLQGRWSNGIG